MKRFPPLIPHGAPGGADERYLVTCEHGGKEVPAEYRTLLEMAQPLLDTHRGYDAGALAMAQALAGALDAHLLYATTTRLLVDLNRSLGNPRIFSEAMRHAPPEVRREIIEAHYLPYRNEVERVVEHETSTGHRVVHVSSQSFVPELDGEVRHADVGLLYDPRRPGEVALCRRWEQALAARAPALRVRRNYPYPGTADGLTTAMRRKFGPESYVGIELEINQRFLESEAAWAAVRDAVIGALLDVVHSHA